MPPTDLYKFALFSGVGYFLDGFQTVNYTISRVGEVPEDKDTSKVNVQQPDNKGRLIIDATACPQDIAYPSDLDLLSGARENTE